MFLLDFSPDTLGIFSVAPEERYGVCIQSILTARKPVPFENWKDVTGILNKLKAIGRVSHSPDGNAINYDLFGDERKLEILSGEKNALLLFIQDGPWAPKNLDTVMNVYQWVYSLQETQQEPPVPEKPSVPEKPQRKLKKEP